MNNKQMIFLADLQETMLQFVSADVGKAAKANLKAIEKANGGAKKLAEADKILADSKIKCDRLVAVANEEALRIIRMAEDNIKGELQALEKKEAGLAKLKDDLTRQDAAAVQKARQLEGAALTLKAREISVGDHDMALEGREKKVAGREIEATKREAEIKRYDDWRAAAPA